MAEIPLTIMNPAGLHARPAALFVQTAVKFQSEISLVKDEKPVNAKSILSVLSLGIHQSETVLIRAHGPDEQAALAALEQLVMSSFGE